MTARTIDPFPLEGVSAAHLVELTQTVHRKFVKFFLRLVGKSEVTPKAVSRLQDSINPVLQAKGCKVWLELLTNPNPNEECVRVSVIIQADDLSEKVRDEMKTSTLRTLLGKKLGETAELVPFAGFSMIEVSAEAELTTADVRDVYIKGMALSDSSYCQILARNGNGQAIGSAGTMIIHSHEAPFCSISESLQVELDKHNDLATDVFVWIDILSVPQRTKFLITQQWLTTTFCDAIGTIGASLIVLAEWRKPLVFERAWCLWEILASIQQGSEIYVSMPPSQREGFDSAVFLNMPGVIKATFDIINSEKAKATNKEDEATILVSIRDSIGFEGANLVAKDRLLEWLSDASFSQAKDPARTKDHLATATFCFRLAKVMSSVQGKHSGAEGLLRKAMDIRTVELGPGHEQTIEVAVALANVFRLQGKSTEAEVTLRKVCELYVATKGEESEETILALGTLSRVLVDRGQFEEAEQICKDLLKIIEKKYGPEDKRTIEALVTLSQLADLRCDSETAAQLLTRVVHGVTALFGPEAPQTLNAKADLAGFLAELENFEEAEALFKEASEKLTAQLGATHEWTVKATTGLNVLKKLRTTLGENFVPGKFAPAEVVTQATSQQNMVPAASAASSSAPVLDPVAAAQDPQLQAKKRVSVVANNPAAQQDLAALRESRLEPVKGPTNKPAARKHLRGYLEKLPVELSQRERERMQRERRQSGAVMPKPGKKGSEGSGMLGGGGRSQMFGGLRKGISSMLGIESSSSDSADKKGSGSRGTSQVFVPQSKSRTGSLDPSTIELNKANQNWERRYFQVQSNQKASSLVYWANEDDCRNGREKRGDFVLDDLNSRIFETSQFGPTCFSITGPKGRLHLKAQSAEEKAQWIDVFKVALAFRGAADKAKMFEKNGAADQAAISTLPPDMPGLGESSIFGNSGGRPSIVQATEKFGSIVNFGDLTRAHSSLLTDPEPDIVT